MGILTKNLGRSQKFEFGIQDNDSEPYYQNNDIRWPPL